MSADDDQLDETLWNLRFGVRRSVRYHRRRRGFYEAWHTLSSGLSVLLATSVVLSLLKQAGELTVATPAVIVAIVSTFDLIVGTTRKAQTHADLGRRFAELEKAMNSEPNPSPEQVADWRNSRLDIEADEPSQLRVVSVLSHNELCRAIGRDQEVYRVGLWRKAVGHFLNIDPRPTKVAA